jgi:hypothetical protein
MRNFVARVRNRVRHAEFLGHGQPHLGALGGGDPALVLQNLPRHVGFLGADQREDVILAVVFAHQRGGEPKSPARLESGGNAEDGRRQKVHLIVDDEPPIAAVEKGEVRKFGVAAFAPGHDLVGGHRDRPDIFGEAAILGHLVFEQRGFVRAVPASTGAPP